LVVVSLGTERTLTGASILRLYGVGRRESSLISFYRTYIRALTTRGTCASFRDYVSANAYTFDENQPRPLAGTLVLDLGQVYGGPYCSLLLARLGARVLKIEPPAGEPLRAHDGAPGAADPIGFQLLNGGKESVVLDLKEPDGRAAFLALAGSADVVVENYAPGTTKKLGIDYEAVRELNPRIVYASLKAYSADTPNRDLRGMDLTVQASSGVMSVNGAPDGPPMRCGPSLVDFLGGSHLALAVLAALIERDAVGHGQAVEVSLQDAVIPTLASNIAGWLTDPATAIERTGNRHGGMRESPYNSYETADGWVAILCITDPQWRSLCDVIEREDLRDDETLATALARVARMLELDDAVSAWTRRHSCDEVTAALQAAGVPASRLKTVAQVIEDERSRTEPMIQEIVDDSGALTYTFGSPVRLTAHPPVPPGRVPGLGEHTEAALASVRDHADGV
jgi:crotonobetainyl-CoA:carnitine CoA-transferase CaiB-like acyl-CoA transferase